MPLAGEVRSRSSRALRGENGRDRDRGAVTRGVPKRPPAAGFSPSCSGGTRPPGPAAVNCDAWKVMADDKEKCPACFGTGFELWMRTAYPGEAGGPIKTLPPCPECGGGRGTPQ